MSKNGVVGWFNSLPRLAQLILLLIPGVNWVIEILVRWSSFIHTKSVLALIFAILVTFFGFGFGWLDLLWCLLFKHMICAKGCCRTVTYLKRNLFAGSFFRGKHKSEAVGSPAVTGNRNPPGTAGRTARGRDRSAS